MKKVFSIIALASALNSYAYDCQRELEKSIELEKNIESLTGITEVEKSLMYEINDNSRKSIELACGLRMPTQVNRLDEIEQARQDILDMNDITEEQRNLMLQINDNAKEAFLTSN